ncbi:unnamed protein product [Phytomonas sp. Hart1]|nr:unnamed protein product [Phytomonas sp. Hart1]|eukprot:CCW72111.1 unnamed protein product [Phytomonas sp. isolate Hart1]
MVNTTTILYAYNKPARSLTLNCFVGEVFSVRGGQNPSEKNKDIDYCRIESQTEYRYNLAVRATYMDSNGVQQISDFSIRDIFTGSLTKPTFRMPVLSTFSIVFTNLATNDRCTLGLGARFDSILNDNPAEGNETEVIPALVALRPPTVYPLKGVGTIFVLQYPKNYEETKAEANLVRLVSPSNSCQESGHGHYMEYTTDIPFDDVPPNPLQKYYMRKHHFYEAGSYRICYQENNTAAGYELGIITVFSGNPIYYIMIIDYNQNTYSHATLLIKFHGYNLDTRKNSDMAKLVDENDSCAYGQPAGGVPLNVPLLPKGNYGPYTTYAFWKIVITQAGSYRVCYKRRGEEWTDVPNIIAAWPSLGPTPDSTPTPFPTPIDPVTNEACPTAPTDGEPWIGYTNLRFTMKKNKNIGELTKMIANLFCVPRSAFTIIRMTHNEAGQQVVYVVFSCSGVTLYDGRPACDSVERSNYAVMLSTINSSFLHDNDIDQIVGSTSIAISGDDPDVLSHNRRFWSTLLICVTAIACTGMFVYAVLKYRERRQYFVQFGMDDDKIDDMYMPAMMMTDTNENSHPDTSQRSFQSENTGVNKKYSD